MTIPLTLFAPLIAALAAIAFLRQPGARPGGLPRVSEWAALAAFATALAGAVQLVVQGPVQVSVFGGPVLIALTLDAVSATMTLLVAFIGWVVLRYSRTYLDGDPKEGAFHGLMLTTLSLVLLLVQSASLLPLIAAFAAIGLVLRRLLLHYSDRAEAQRAATKFAWAWHSGDVALVAGALCLWVAYGTADLDRAAAAFQGGVPLIGHIGIGFVVLAAALKTATFPVHGWLTEVMEAPTPVSALLHAGIINAGGVLLIRMADLVQPIPGAMGALVLLGGFTALFGAVVMLTQSAVKTALAWSTVAQMGFMLLQCGLGLWPLALLHIVAHSMYKAHAFLASGGAVQAVLNVRRPGPVAVPDLGAVAKSFAIAVTLYAIVAGVFIAVFGAKSPQALALGAMLIFGVAYLVAQGLADSAPVALTRRTAVASAATAIAYFTFQLGADALWGASLPPVPLAGPFEWALIVLAVISFGSVAVAQTLFPLWAHHPAAAGVRVHIANGLYLNAVLDRLIGGFDTKPNT